VLSRNEDSTYSNPQKYKIVFYEISIVDFNLSLLTYVHNLQYYNNEHFIIHRFVSDIRIFRFWKDNIFIEIIRGLSGRKRGVSLSMSSVAIPIEI
jgi:hypothetical protein